MVLRSGGAMRRTSRYMPEIVRREKPRDCRRRNLKRQCDLVEQNKDRRGALRRLRAYW